MSELKFRFGVQTEPLVRMPEGLSHVVMLTEMLRNLFSHSILLMDYEGRIHCANDTVVRGFMMDSADELYMKTYRDFAPEAWANERINLFQHVIDTGESSTLLEIFAGYKLRSRIRHIPVPTEQSPKGYVLITVERLDSRVFDYLCESNLDLNIVHANHIDLGRLDVLSTRELEVLALMGQGYRAREIASMLFRSVSTIENHRENIGKKLGVTDRAELARIAQTAVLRVEDANRTRVQFSVNSSTVTSESLPDEPFLSRK